MGVGGAGRRLLPPILKSALTSGSTLCGGDLLCQSLTKEPDAPYDVAKAARFGLVGLTLHGPFFHRGFQWLDRSWGPSKSLGTAVGKMVSGQLTLFPTYLAAFFFYMGALEGRPLRDCLECVRAGVPPAFTGGCIFWPAVNIANFMFVPPTLRVAYVNACGLGWNGFLSLKHQGIPEHPPVAEGAGLGLACQVKE